MRSLRLSGEDVDQGRPLPQSLEAERAVLGGLMLDPARVPEVAELVSPEDFYREAHQNLFRLMVEMDAGGAPTEMVAVVERIAATTDPDKYGGIAYVSSLSDNVPSTENLEYYARLVHRRAVARRLALVGRKITDKALEAPDDLPELVEFAESTLFAVTQERGAEDWKQLSELVDTEFLRIQKLSEDAGDVTGVPTGFIDLDRKLAGLQPSDLVILAARPSMGKTSLALNIARHAARTVGVGIFSLEMSRGQIATRLLCAEARVDASRIRTGFLSKDQDWPALTRAAEELYPLPLFIDDTPGLNVNQIRSKTRRLKSLHPELGLIVVDYIGLMSGDPRLSREQQVAASSRGLKALAKELNLTVLALSQLNRGVEQRPNKRPLLSDLRESGAIEQDADVIMFIYRDEYYNKDNSAEPGVAEVIIAKQRNGPTGVVKLAFQGRHTRFDNLAENIGEGGYL